MSATAKDKPMQSPFVEKPEAHMEVAPEQENRDAEGRHVILAISCPTHGHADFRIDVEKRRAICNSCNIDFTQEVREVLELIDSWGIKLSTPDDIQTADGSL